MNSNLEFFSNFLHNPRQVAAVAPSSKHVVNSIVDDMDFNKAKCIVEYGPGTGALTKGILEKLNSDGKLICFEPNSKFCRFIHDNLKDSRLTIINDSAEKMGFYFKKYGFHNQIDYALSSIPFTLIGEERKNFIIKSTYSRLTKNGKFIVYQQYTPYIKKYLGCYFKKISMKFEFRNVPPTFIYVCEKRE